MDIWIKTWVGPLWARRGPHVYTDPGTANSTPLLLFPGSTVSTAIITHLSPAISATRDCWNLPDIVLEDLWWTNGKMNKGQLVVYDY